MNKTIKNHVTPNEATLEENLFKADLAFADEILEKLNDFNRNFDQNIAILLPLNDIVKILQLVSVIIMQESSLLETEGPIKIVGDIHGQFRDLNNLLDLIGRAPDIKLLFLGGIYHFFSIQGVNFIFLKLFLIITLIGVFNLKIFFIVINSKMI